MTEDSGSTGSSSPQPTVATPPATATAATPGVRSRRRWITYLLLGGAAVAVLAAVGVQRRRAMVLASPPVTPPSTAHFPPPLGIVPGQDVPGARVQSAPERPRVELVFALDTTGSMGGLIEGAKQKIWSLASFVARGQPTPDLRIGLVAYRDIGDQYVTRVHDLDGDLDRVYQRLRRFEADGGGDTPEHVARALSEAVHRMSWTDQATVTKIIYLVGDAPPHTDYRDGHDLLGAARAAAQRNIQVHTIRCGDDPSTAAAWRRVASLGKGQFLTIGQDGGMREAHSPFDGELARLHDELSSTALGYGAAAPAVTAAVASAAAASVEAKAERAAFMAAKRKAVASDAELVDAVATGRVSLDAMEPEALPAELRHLDRAARRARIDEMQARRRELTARIAEVAKKRQEFLDRQAERDRARGAARGFDAVAKESLRNSVNAGLSGLKL